MIAFQHLVGSTLFLFLRPVFLIFVKLTAAHIFLLLTLMLIVRTHVSMAILIVRFHHIINARSIAFFTLASEPLLVHPSCGIPVRRVPTLLEKL